MWICKDHKENAWTKSNLKKKKKQISSLQQIIMLKVGMFPIYENGEEKTLSITATTTTTNPKENINRRENKQ